MLKDKVEGFTIEHYADNKRTIENYLEILKDEDVDPTVYMTLMALMRNNVFMTKTVLILADYLGSRGLLSINGMGDIELKGDNITPEEKFAMTESFCLVKEIAPYLEKISDEEIELLSVLFINSVATEEKNVVIDSSEVQ